MDMRTLRAKFKALAPSLNERCRRLWGATEAKALGRGGITMVARATRFSGSTIAQGIRELEVGEELGRGACGGLAEAGSRRSRTIPP